MSFLNQNFSFLQYFSKKEKRKESEVKKKDLVMIFKNFHKRLSHWGSASASLLQATTPYYSGAKIFVLQSFFNKSQILC